MEKDFEEYEQTLEERMAKYGFDTADEEAAALSGSVAGGSMTSGGGGGGERKEGEGADNGSLLSGSMTTYDTKTDVEAGGEDEGDEEEMGVLAQLKAEKLRVELEAKRLAAEEQAREEAEVTDWTEWKCIICQTKNKRPTHPKLVNDVVFGTVGVYYKRTFAKITPRRDIPVCTKCFTPSDYKTPMSSAHTFPYEPDPYKAFNNYPKKVEVQAGLSNVGLIKWSNYLYSFFGGLRNNSSSLLVYNDWRLRLFLNSRFPELPRYKKPPDEFYVIGEIVECMQQKSDWQRCKITNVRKNHTYDIKYDPGDELRFVPETALRLPPEKRKFAYRVEMCVVSLVFTVPLGLIAAYAIDPGLIFFGPAIMGVFLLLLRINIFFKNFYSHFSAGCCIIFRLSLFYTLPIIFLIIASASPYLAPGMGLPYVMVSYAWAAVFIFVLPIFYIMKPAMIVFGTPLFILFVACLYLTGRYLDGNPLMPYVALCYLPLFLMTLYLIYLRRKLHTIWDVCAKARPRMYFIPEEEMSMREQLQELCGSCFGGEQ
jgi:hypothetical protein